jgi:hypothetical protein
MESRPKYIEVDSHYELDEGFVDGIMELSAHHRLRVLRQINSAIEDLEQDNDDTLFAGGRVGSDLYYKFEYYNIEGWMPVLLSFEPVEVDDYLDMMIDNTLVIS